MDQIPQKRVVTLIASATEIVSALGCVDWLVGRSHECDFPAQVAKLPVLTEPKFKVEGSSNEIDQRVKAIVEEGLSVYRVHAEELDAVAPEVIVTQDQCEVCAVSLPDVEKAVCEITNSDARIVSLRPDALKDVWTDIARVAQALDLNERGAELIESLQARMTELTSQCAAQQTKPGVACIEWIEPLMAGGNWMPELVEMAGSRNLFGEAGKHSPWMEWQDIRAADPDVILVMPCGFDIARTLEEMPLMAAREGWSNLKAVREGRVVVADGNQYFNRPGPRLVESLEILAEVCHPGSFDFGHQGTGWVNFSTP